VPKARVGDQDWFAVLGQDQFDAVLKLTVRRDVWLCISDSLSRSSFTHALVVSRSSILTKQTLTNSN
jgi:hypothetical protein